MVSRTGKIFRVAAVVAILAVAPAGSALAASSSVQGYNSGAAAGLGATEGSGPGPNSAGEDGGAGGSPTERDDTAGSLPFTGADLGLPLAAGAALFLLGLGLRRLTWHEAQ